jgi:predicted kinase
MNELIEKLFDQAKVECFKMGSKPATTVGYDELEKFAQLIVKECSKVIVNGGYWSGGPLGDRRQCTPPEIAKMIKDHFGVEE